jgi:hypothetical protein
MGIVHNDKADAAAFDAWTGNAPYASCVTCVCPPSVTERTCGINGRSTTAPVLSRHDDAHGFTDVVVVGGAATDSLENASPRYIWSALVYRKIPHTGAVEYTSPLKNDGSAVRLITYTHVAAP